MEPHISLECLEAKDLRMIAEMLQLAGMQTLGRDRDILKEMSKQFTFAAQETERLERVA